MADQRWTDYGTPPERPHFGPLSFEGRVLVESLSRSIAASELFFDSLASSNYVAGSAGFKIDTDGTAEFASGVTIGPGSVTIASDLESSNWGGASPANLTAGPDESGTPAGYYLDYSAGAGQFESIYARGGQIEAMDVTGVLTFSGGEINSGSVAPYISLTEASEDAGAAGHVLEFVRNLTDGRHPKIHATDDVIGIYSRHIGTSITDQAAVILTNENKDTLPRIQLTLDQLDGTDGAWLQMWDVGDTVKGFELAGGTEWSATNLGAGEQFIRLWNQGDGGTVGIYGNPVAAEEILYVADGNPGSESLKFSVNSDGPAYENAVTVFPSQVSATPAQVTTFASTNWIAGTAYTLWTHGGTGRDVWVSAIARFEWGETAAVAYTGECRLGISFNGGSTWNYGASSICYVGTGTGGCGYRSSGTVIYESQAAAAAVTGDIQMRLEYKVGNTSMDRLHNIHLMGRVEQIF